MEILKRNTGLSSPLHWSRRVVDVAVSKIERGLLDMSAAHQFLAFLHCTIWLHPLKNQLRGVIVRSYTRSRSTKVQRGTMTRNDTLRTFRSQIEELKMPALQSHVVVCDNCPHWAIKWVNKRKEWIWKKEKTNILFVFNERIRGKTRISLPYSQNTTLLSVDRQVSSEKTREFACARRWMNGQARKRRKPP